MEQKNRYEKILMSFSIVLSPLYVTSLLAINLKVTGIYFLSYNYLSLFFLSFQQQFNTTSKLTLSIDTVVIF